jgi:hypothetical protein
LFSCPDFADVFVGRGAAEGLKSTGEIFGRHYAGEARTQLVVVIVVV